MRRARKSRRSWLVAAAWLQSRWWVEGSMLLEGPRGDDVYGCDSLLGLLGTDGRVDGGLEVYPLPCPAHWFREARSAFSSLLVAE